MKSFFAALCFLGLATPALAASDVRIDDNNVFPESLGSANGALYVGSAAKGIIYRALPGKAFATPWIAPVQGFERVLGVVADAPSNTLWACYATRGKSSLRTYNLKTAVPKADYDFPDGGACNDILVKKDEIYATDIAKGRIVKLAKGAKDLAIWYQSPAEERGVDGIAFGRDGKLYITTYQSHHLIRIDVNPDGSAGTGTVLTTSLPLYQPDGLRLSPGGKLLLAEGQGRGDDPDMKKGRLDEVVIDGDQATIKVLKDGYQVPTAVTAIGNTAYVLESKSNYQRRPELRGQDSGAFYVYAVPVQ